MLLLCFGYGYVAHQLAALVQARGGRVVGTTRDGRAGSIAYDGGALSPALIAAITQASHILIATPPHTGEAACAQAVAAHAARARWRGYLSTTGVYGDCAGAWVTETSPLRPGGPRGQARVAAEMLWRTGGAHIFRLSGIYGPHRSAFEAIREGRGQRIHKPGHLFNRIHGRDIARALMASMQAPTAGEIFNLSDDLPAPQADVMGYAYQLLGQTPPPPIAFAQAQLSPMAQEFYAASRCVDASKIKRMHGMQWLFPTYRDGLAGILQEEGDRSPMLKDNG